MRAALQKLRNQRPFSGRGHCEHVNIPLWEKPCFNQAKFDRLGGLGGIIRFVERLYIRFKFQIERAVLRKWLRVSDPEGRLILWIQGDPPHYISVCDVINLQCNLVRRIVQVCQSHKSGVTDFQLDFHVGRSG